MFVRYDLPVCDANMHQAVKDILAEMKAHNEKYPGLFQTVLDIQYWTMGDPSGDNTDDEFWKVVIYEKITDLFYVYQIHDSWFFDTRQVDVYKILLPRGEVKEYLDAASAIVGKQEVA